MVLSSSATAGIILAISFILLLSSGAVYYTKRRLRQNELSKATTSSSPTSSDPSAFSLQHIEVSCKRADVADLRHQQQHTRYPSLENGPGPTLVNTPGPDAPAIDTIRRVVVTPAASASSTRVQPPTTATSSDRSSLHRAVLDVGVEDDQKKSDDTVQEADEHIRAQDLEHNPVGKAYTGAWPLRDVNSASNGR
jgi:hypothetical protein